MAFSGIPVLNYHAIDNNNITPASKNVSVSLSSFREQMGWLKNEGYKTIDTQELREVILHKKPCSGKSVLITFDDGYYSLYKYALEILSKYEFTAMLFLSTAYMGKSYEQNDFYFVKHDRQLTWDEVRELSANGWSIQSHGNTHVKMTGIGREALIGEVTVSKNIIEQNLGKPVDSFAFPYGIYNNAVITRLKEADYSFAYSVHSGKLFPSANRFHLPRIEINNMDSMESFKTKVLTGYTSPANAVRSKVRDLVYANSVIKDLVEKLAHRIGFGNR
jgi:peptidoglycan/xylan/chitin deacetylase (PgdA/CDA1 family)